MNRRQWLGVVGSAGVVITAGGFGGFAATRSPEAALRPWRMAGEIYPDPMRNALSYAILAPNPHNRQPWAIRLHSDTEATLFCDMQRLLPVTDPFDRQIVIGLGCFLELFELAARARGYRAYVEPFPAGEPGERLDAGPVARLRLQADDTLAADPLFDQVLLRRTNRNAYDTERTIDEAALRALAAVVDNAQTTGPGKLLHTLRTLSRDAFIGEIRDVAAFNESVELMRIGRREIEANPDGISLRGTLLETLNLIGVLTREQLADPASGAFQTGLDMAETSAMTAMGFVWINTRGNTRYDQLQAGRGYLRVALRATELGLAMQPMSQALQEYEAMQPYYRQVHELLAATSGERVQMLARLGYAAPVAPAPRWALATRTV